MKERGGEREREGEREGEGEGVGEKYFGSNISFYKT